MTSEFDELPLTVENFPIIKGLRASAIGDLAFSATSAPLDANKALREDIGFGMDMAEYERALLVEVLKRHRTIGDAAKRCVWLDQLLMQNEKNTALDESFDRELM